MRTNQPRRNFLKQAATVPGLSAVGLPRETKADVAPQPIENGKWRALLCRDDDWFDVGNLTGNELVKAIRGYYRERLMIDGQAEFFVSQDVFDRLCSYLNDTRFREPQQDDSGVPVFRRAPAIVIRDALPGRILFLRKG